MGVPRGYAHTPPFACTWAMEAKEKAGRRVGTASSAREEVVLFVRSIVTLQLGLLAADAGAYGGTVRVMCHRCRGGGALTGTLHKLL